MQRELIDRIRALMDEGVATRVLGWKHGEFFYDTEPAILAAEQLDQLVYDSFCGPNLSKYLIQEMPKLGEGEKVIPVFIDTDRIAEVRKKLPSYEDRRPELYQT